jgi:hypothetical protein
MSSGKTVDQVDGSPSSVADIVIGTRHDSGPIRLALVKLSRINLRRAVTGDLVHNVLLESAIKSIIVVNRVRTRCGKLSREGELVN